MYTIGLALMSCLLAAGFWIIFLNINKEKSRKKIFLVIIGIISIFLSGVLYGRYLKEREIEICEQERVLHAPK